MLCNECKVNPIFHRRKQLCAPCYKIFRKAQWKLNDKIRCLDPLFIKNRKEYKAYYFQKNKKHLSKLNAEYEKFKLKNDINFLLRKTLRRRLTEAVKNNCKSGSAVHDLGCSIDELKTYVESKFLPGMTWKTYGRKGWHIDHIKPLSKFDLTNKEELKRACHYTNLQPMWWKDNLSKGNKSE